MVINSLKELEGINWHHNTMTEKTRIHNDYKLSYLNDVLIISCHGTKTTNRTQVQSWDNIGYVSDFDPKSDTFTIHWKDTLDSNGDPDAKLPQKTVIKVDTKDKLSAQNKSKYDYGNMER